MSKFTPGPWIKSLNEIETTDGQTIATVSRERDGFVQANLNLLAAAPDLYAILSRILRAHDTNNNGAVMGEAVLCHQFAEIARAALAKADGQ